MKFQLDLKLNGEEGDMSTFVLNGEWALLGMQSLIWSDLFSTKANIHDLLTVDLLFLPIIHSLLPSTIYSYIIQGMGCDWFLGRTHAPRTSRFRCAHRCVRTSNLGWSHFAPAPFVNFSTIFQQLVKGKLLRGQDGLTRGSYQTVINQLTNFRKKNPVLECLFLF